jgi:hypothetical protein
MRRKTYWEKPLTEQEAMVLDAKIKARDTYRKLMHRGGTGRHPPPAYKVVRVGGSLRDMLPDPDTGESLFGTKEEAQSAIDRTIAKFGYDPVSFNASCIIKGVS